MVDKDLEVNFRVAKTLIERGGALHDTPPIKCPRCGSFLHGSSSSTRDHPASGDITICGGRLCTLEFVEDMTVREFDETKLSPAERFAVDDMRRVIVAAMIGK